jgi:hypothetical protein
MPLHAVLIPLSFDSSSAMLSLPDTVMSKDAHAPENRNQLSRRNEKTSTNSALLIRFPSCNRVYARSVPGFASSLPIVVVVVAVEFVQTSLKAAVVLAWSTICCSPLLLRHFDIAPCSMDDRGK